VELAGKYLFLAIYLQKELLTRSRVGWRVGFLLISAHSSISDRKLTNIDMIDIVQ
jgi:hypothetical protein